jgi:quinol monooxygenase YgiN
MVEIWESKEALDRHMGSDHFGELIPGGEIYKAAPTEIRIFNRV